MALTKFVSWLNGITVFQIKPGKDYGLLEFDKDLRDVMRRAGCKGQKISFIFNESNNLGIAFIEKMNALLASGDVPGLFEGEEMTNLLNQIKESLGKNSNAQSNEEIYDQFVRKVQANLHVVFKMNPSGGDFSSKATNSPAIFNRCVIDWFQDWDKDSLILIADEIVQRVDFLEDPGNLPECFFGIHQKVIEINESLKNQ